MGKRGSVCEIPAANPSAEYPGVPAIPLPRTLNLQSDPFEHQTPLMKPRSSKHIWMTGVLLSLCLLLSGCPDERSGETAAEPGDRLADGAAALGKAKARPCPEGQPDSSGTCAGRRQPPTPATSSDRADAVYPEMVRLPGGTFMMGSDDSDEAGEASERPRHPVTVAPFAIGKIFGQEKNITTYNLARMNMLLHGVKDSEFEIYHGDTLLNEWDWLREQNPARMPRFDAIVSNPPFSYRWEPTEALGRDMRFKNHGLAPKSAADFAFLLHGFHYLKPDGVMAIILPHGVLFRGGAE